MGKFRSGRESNRKNSTTPGPKTKYATISQTMDAGIIIFCLLFLYFYFLATKCTEINTKLNSFINHEFVSNRQSNPTCLKHEVQDYMMSINQQIVCFVSFIFVQCQKLTIRSCSDRYIMCQKKGRKKNTFQLECMFFLTNSNSPITRKGIFYLNENKISPSVVARCL